MAHPHDFQGRSADLSGHLHPHPAGAGADEGGADVQNPPGTGGTLGPGAAGKLARAGGPAAAAPADDPAGL